jgi:hypothetical protein
MKEFSVLLILELLELFYFIFDKKLFFERSGGGNCEAISDGAERVLNFSILYTHPHTLLGTYAEE